jgi:hypothetical protein
MSLAHSLLLCLLGASSTKGFEMGHIKGRCEPAYSVIRRFGGVTPTARILSLSPSTVSRWLIEDGTAGKIPQNYWKFLIAYAKKRKIEISLAELFGS